MKYISLLILSGLSLVTNGQFMTIKITGQKSGQFKGESLRSGETDRSDLIGYVLDVKTPIDAATAQSTGRRQYQPITIWKRSGASSPQYFSALATNEEIRNVVIQYSATDATGRLQPYYTVELENVRVVGYKQLFGTPEPQGLKLAGDLPVLYDEIKISFVKITVTQLKERTTATDDTGATAR
jgi:type VI secretion system Hcp family effector